MNKKTNFFGVLLLALLFLPLFAGAQAQLKTPEERAARRTDSLKTILSLTDAQYPQVYNINFDFAKKADPILKSSDSRAVKLRKLKPLDDERDAALKGVLTEDQYNRYITEKKERRQDAREKIKERRKNR